MAEIFTLEHLVTLGLLVVLQAVLGFDNLLYISLESKKAPEEKQGMVRSLGIGIAIFLRIGLLFLLVSMIKYFQDPIFDFHLGESHGTFNIHSLIVLLGGAFIVYTAMKEIWHMMSLGDGEDNKPKKRSVGSVIFWIVLMNLVFSFDSILSAMALSESLIVMTTAIIISGLLMIWLSGSVSRFLQKNRMYEVLGLFILFVVGIMLITEGGHLAHLTLFGEPITPMTKTTFYFVLAVLLVTDIVQGRYQKKLAKEKAKQTEEVIDQ